MTEIIRRNTIMVLPNTAAFFHGAYIRWRKTGGIAQHYRCEAQPIGSCSRPSGSYETVVTSRHV